MERFFSRHLTFGSLSNYRFRRINLVGFSDLAEDPRKWNMPISTEINFWTWKSFNLLVMSKLVVYALFYGAFFRPSFWATIKCTLRTQGWFLFSFRKILKFRRNKGFEQGMLLSTETRISWPQYFFSSWGLPNVRKVRNARVSAASRVGNLDGEYEQARVFIMATAIGHYQCNFHVNRSGFFTITIQNVFVFFKHCWSS